MNGRSGQDGAADGLGVALVLGSSTGGIGAHVASLAGGLAAGGARVTVCGPADAEELFGFTGRGAGFVPVEIPANPRLRDARAVLALRSSLAAAEPDVVHAHGLRAGFVAAAARGGRPLVVTWHNAVLGSGGGLRGRANRRIEGWVARAADITLCASTDLVERASALGARDVRLAEVAAPTLPARRRSAARVRRELGLAPGAPLVLSVGRLHPQKRYDVLVAAAARWRRLSPAPLVVVAGRGPSYIELSAQISRERAPVLLAGHRTDVADLLGAADLAVVTSAWEARQLFAQEALAAGVPLVATRVGGIPELVGDAAVLVPPGDVDALDAAVRQLLGDAQLRRSYAERGSAQARTWPTERDTVDQVRNVYAELVAPARPAGEAGPP
ncbi:MAG TPA: glycosyltransferase family 4 protein [Micromonosporaceae bacterium]|nr:glycosyltransferase family 4 protein [Micromonosporaceae bacterium]